MDGCLAHAAAEACRSFVGRHGRKLAKKQNSPISNAAHVKVFLLAVGFEVRSVYNRRCVIGPLYRAIAEMVPQKARVPCGVSLAAQRGASGLLLGLSL